MNKFTRTAIALSLLGSLSTEFYAMKNSKKRVREEDVVAHSGTDSDAEDVGKRSYACDVVGCGKKFTGRSNLARHKKSVHKGVRYSCNECGKEFAWQNGLSLHKKSAHEGVKYPCDTCGQEFSWQAQLSEHKKSVHEGVRYVCEYPGCGKGFTDKSNLCRHKKSVHEGVRYSCDECGKGFTFQRYLSEHKKSAHEGIRYSCGTCGRGFADKSNLAHHRREKRCKKGKQKKKRPLIADVVRVEDPVVDVDYEIILLQEAGAAFGELDGFEGAVVEGEELGTVIKVESTASAEEIMRCIEDGIGIEELQIKNNPHVTDKELVEIASNCLLLEKLDVRGCNGITSEGIRNFLGRCGGLCTLVVSEHDALTAADISQLRGTSPGLVIEVIR